MAQSDAQQQNPHIVSSTEQGNKIPRLFNFDVPTLKQTGQAWPEQSDSSSIHRVLDIASGTGEWTISAAQAHPQLQILGVERDPHLVEQARSQAHAQGVENTTWLVGSPFQRLDLPEAAFDLVNARYIVGMLQAPAWTQLLREARRLTRPGGIIRLTETDLPISNGISLERLGAWISQAFFQTNRSFAPEARLLSVTPALKPLLQEAGCQQVREAVTSINFSAAMPAHAAVCQDLAKAYRQVLPFLIQEKVATQPDIEQTYQQMLTEMQSEDFVALVFSLTAWGIRP